MEDQPNKTNEESSVIKTLRNELKEAKAELKLKPSQENLDALNTKLEALEQKDLIATYGVDNVEEAKKLKQVGFEESRIKEMLNKTVSLNDDEADLTEEEKNLSKKPIVIKEEDTKETEAEKFKRETLARISKDQ